MLVRTRFEILLSEPLIRVITDVYLSLKEAKSVVSTFRFKIEPFVGNPLSGETGDNVLLLESRLFRDSFNALDGNQD